MFSLDLCGLKISEPISISCARAKFVSLQLQFMEKDLLKRITLLPDICFGKPSIRGLRYPVELILDLLSAGMTEHEILSDYPDLEVEDIRACLLFASRLIKVNTIEKVIAA